MAKGPSIRISRTGDISADAKESLATKWCKPCLEDLGEERHAHRIMHKGGGRCEEHFRLEQGMSQLSPRAEAFIARWRAVVKGREAANSDATIVSKNAPFVSPASAGKEQNMRKPARKLDDSTIAEIRKDHAAGMSVEQIRKKHNVGWITAKNAIDKGGKSSAKARPNGRGSNRRDATNEAVVAVSVDLLDRLLLALPPEKKAALLETV